MKPGIALSLIAVGLLTLGACTAREPSHWSKPGTSGDKTTSDLGYCKRLARDEVERLYGNRRADDTYEVNMRAYEAGKAEKRMVSQCMAQLGYTAGR